MKTWRKRRKHMGLVKKTIEGFKMYLDPKDGGISMTLVQKGGREKAFMFLLRTEASGIALDCGANIGYCTLSLAEKCEKVLAFEPDERSYKLLEKNMAGHKNCFLFRDALGEHIGLIGFKKDKRPNLSRVTTKGKKLVRCVTIDTLEEPFNFIKMDIEGGEVAALKGARRTLSEATNIKLLIEVHPQMYGPDNNFSDVLWWLVNAGYKFSYVINAKGKSAVIEEKYKAYTFFPNYERKIYKNIVPEDAIPWACTMPADKKKVLRAIMLEKK
jgi:FkbM family methyltransferase